MSQAWLKTICDVPWCQGFDPDDPEGHVIEDDLNSIKTSAQRHHRMDVVLLADECGDHEPQHVFPDGRIVSVQEHKEFVALAREAATDPDPNDPGIGPDWVACIQALQHEGTGGGSSVRDEEYDDEVRKCRVKHWKHLMRIVQQRRKGKKPPPWKEWRKRWKRER